ncbi:MAG: epoxyqueuosine reductase QueH [Candidatus Hydrothermarchaeales archaeon]
MRLLLHICCAPCSTETITRLLSEHEVTGFFYNPNIHPREEYDLRRLELEKYADEQDLPLIVSDYDVERWTGLTRGLEAEPEGGRRCTVCFQMRLEKTAQTAAELGFDAFTTTLSISPHKNSAVINAVGAGVEREKGVLFLAEDFKKQDGFKKSVERSKRHGLRRQSYCGCVYSKKERESK